MRPATRPDIADAGGFSLTEVIVAMGILTIVMGATLAGLADISKGNELVMSISAMNSALRAGTDLMIRDLLQAGSGLPSSHTVSIPSGSGSVRVRIPGPPGTAFTTDAADDVLPAVIPLDGAGPTINGVATDVLAVLMSDNAFVDMAVSAVGNSHVIMPAGINIGSGANLVSPGDLMIIKKLSYTTLVQVTTIDAGSRRINFANNDSLRLNQPAAANGNLAALIAEEPTGAAGVSSTLISRLRLITYYLDNTTEPAHPRLVRRVNNGDAMTFNNALLGTAVAIDTFDLQFTYDISNGTNNPGGVSMTAADVNGTGACAPDPCAATQIRKVNMRLTTRAPNQVSGATKLLSNTLESQVSLRAMAFVDRYLAP